MKRIQTLAVLTNNHHISDKPTRKESMSLFQCENCGGRENTALSLQGTKAISEYFDWTGIEDRKGKFLCSACAPAKHSDGTDSKLGAWHGEFPQLFLPIGEFKTNGQGNLEHIQTGDTDIQKYAIKL